MEIEVQRRRKIGRPKRRWLDKVRGDIKNGLLESHMKHGETGRDAVRCSATGGCQ